MMGENRHSTARTQKEIASHPWLTQAAFSPYLIRDIHFLAGQPRDQPHTTPHDSARHWLPFPHSLLTLVDCQYTAVQRQSQPFMFATSFPSPLSFYSHLALKCQHGILIMIEQLVRTWSRLCWSRFPRSSFLGQVH